MKKMFRRTAVAVAVSLALSAADAREVLRRDAVTFDIDAPSMTQALMQFTEQSGLQLMMPTDGAGKVPARKIVGLYTPTAALDQLLAGTALKYEFANARTVAITTAGEKGEQAIHLVSSDQAGEKTLSDVAQTPDVPATHATGLRSAADDGSPPKKVIPEILVRGSRTMNVDVVRSEDDVQPYTILSSEEIQRSGAENIEDFLKRQLNMSTTAQTNSQSFASNNGTTSSINLRGLGSNETLILIDGRRTAGISITGSDYQADINGIPLSVVERIEVLPSSASAIYGGAAMGGGRQRCPKKGLYRWSSGLLL